MFAAVREKAPGDDLTFTFDFTDWAFLASDPMTSSAVVTSPSGLTLGSPGLNAAGTKVSLTIAGGTDGITYLLTCTGTTAAGRDVVGYGRLNVLALT